MELQFTKMQAYGNDYVYVNAISQEIGDPQALARRVSERHFGIGSDGLVLIRPSRRGEFRLRMATPCAPCPNLSTTTVSPTTPSSRLRPWGGCSMSGSRRRGAGR